MCSVRKMQNRNLYMWYQNFGPCWTFVNVLSWLTAVLVLLVILIFAVIILQNATSFTQSPCGMTQAETESRRGRKRKGKEREKDRKPLSPLPGAHRQSLRYGNANSLDSACFFYGCLGSWSDHWTWHRRWWLGHWHKKCVCWCVTIPSPQQHPLTIDDITYVCESVAMVIALLPREGQRGADVGDLCRLCCCHSPLTSRINLSLPTGVTDYYISHL